MKAGALCGGRLPTLSGQSIASRPPLEQVAGRRRPTTPATSATSGTVERRSPSASSAPWSGYGEWRSRPSGSRARGAPAPRRGAPARARTRRARSAVIGDTSSCRRARGWTPAAVRARARGAAPSPRRCGMAGRKRRKSRKSVAEDADRPEEQPPVHPGRRVVRPGGREEVAGERDGDDDEALRPHADVDQDRRRRRGPPRSGAPSGTRRSAARARCRRAASSQMSAVVRRCQRLRKAKAS